MRRALPTALLATVVLLPALAVAGPADDAMQRGEQLLSQGKFREALSAYATAVQADRENRENVSRYMMLRRVVQLRQQFQQETNDARLAYLARALRQFYMSHDLHEEALALDKRVHRQLRDTRSALALADTQLEMGRNSEALATLSDLPNEQQNTSTRALRAIALSRLGKKEEAKRVADDVELAEGSGLGITYAVARMHAATGQPEKAVGALSRFFESVPPSQQPAFREVARNCPEFGELTRDTAFQTALETESKVSESECSGGKSCAGCPMRGNCPGSK